MRIVELEPRHSHRSRLDDQGIRRVGAAGVLREHPQFDPKRLFLKMTMANLDEALTEGELDRLQLFLSTCKGGAAMSLEEMDGFFASLIAGPELVPPSEYLPEVLGGPLSEVCALRPTRLSD